MVTAEAGDLRYYKILSVRQPSLLNRNFYAETRVEVVAQCENIALMYAMPVTDKLSVAVGGYFNNINYAGNNWREAGLSAVL